MQSLIIADAQAKLDKVGYSIFGGKGERETGDRSSHTLPRDTDPAVQTHRAVDLPLQDKIRPP
jgi:hypothetical protein